MVLDIGICRNVCTDMPLLVYYALYIPLIPFIPLIPPAQSFTAHDKLYDNFVVRTRVLLPYIPSCSSLPLLFFSSLPRTYILR